MSYPNLHSNLTSVSLLFQVGAIFRVGGVLYLSFAASWDLHTTLGTR